MTINTEFNAPGWNGKNFVGSPANPLFVDYVIGGGHASVEGWVTPGALGILTVVHMTQQGLGVSGNVAEIGVHHGRFFIALAHTCNPGEHAVALDVFEDQHLNIDHSGHGDRAIFEANLGKFGVDSRQVAIHKRDSLEIGASGAARSVFRDIKIFSVDGGHTYIHLVNDMKVAEDTIVDGGVVIVDDFFNPQWPEVTAGTFAYLAGQTDLRPFAYGDNKLFLARSAWHSLYMSAIHHTHVATGAAHKMVVISGHDAWWVRGRDPSELLRRVENPLGEILDVSIVGGAADGVLGRGWESPEEWGVWSTGSASDLYVLFSEPLREDRVRIDIYANASVRRPGDMRDVRLLVNGADSGRMSFSDTNAMRSAVVPVAAGSREVRITFEPLDVFSPKDAHVGADDRPLGIGLRSLRVTAI